ncbi:replication protein RepA [Microcoleus sp. B7-D4]|uniref:replication protein RepA n=1 Tax=Microcoleus sp. B7-D4 TaxID=2818696 RepID=UPI002FD2A036
MPDILDDVPEHLRPMELTNPGKDQPLAARTSEVESKREPSQRRGYLARELVQCTLPHRDPKADTYSRTDGNFRMIVESGLDARTLEKVGIPYGSIPRLVLLWLNTEAVRKQGKENEREIHFGNTLNDFLRSVGLSPTTGGGKRGDAARVRVQCEKLFAARFTFARIEGDDLSGSTNSMKMDVAKQVYTWWDYRNPDQGSFWESYIVLDEDFHRALVANPVPFDIDHLRALKRSPLAIDLYSWLTYRLFRLGNDYRGVTISYSDLKKQFGSEYSRDDNFKAALKEALERVSDVFSAIRYELAPHGLIVAPVSAKDLPVQPERKIVSAVPGKAAVQIESPVAHHVFQNLTISAKDWKRIAKLAENLGKDAHQLFPLWKAWVFDEKVQVANPAAHFIQFLKRHDSSRKF